jgi:hypothetical protein
MLYRIIGEEFATHRHVDIPNWDAPDTATAMRLATQIGIVVSRIEPINRATPAAQEDVGRNAPTTIDATRNAPTTIDANRLASRNDIAVLEGPRIGMSRPQAILITLGLLVVLAVIGVVAWQALNTVGSRAEATFLKTSDQLRSSTSDATPYATAEGKPQTTQTTRSDLIDAGAKVLKELQQLREQWEERSVKTIGTLRMHYETFRVTFTEDQSNLLQHYIKRFKELDAEGMAQFAAIEQGSLDPTSIRIRLQRITQLDQEWKEAGREFARQGREVGLQ